MICSECKLNKPEEHFAFRNKAEGKRHKKCKQCQNNYTSRHYLENADTYKSNAKTNNALAREKHRVFIFEYLKAHPCVDCGESDIIVLEFDHRDPLLKVGGRISSFIGTSIKKLQSEIDKCDVVCANCHTRRTAKYFGWKRLDYI